MLIGLEYFGTTDPNYTYKMRLAIKIYQEERARVRKLLTWD